MTINREMKFYGVYKHHLSETQRLFDDIREYFGRDGYIINLELIDGKYIKLMIETETYDNEL